MVAEGPTTASNSDEYLSAVINPPDTQQRSSDTSASDSSGSHGPNPGMCTGPSDGTGVLVSVTDINMIIKIAMIQNPSRRSSRVLTPSEAIFYTLIIFDEM